MAPDERMTADDVMTVSEIAEMLHVSRSDREQMGTKRRGPKRQESDGAASTSGTKIEALLLTDPPGVGPMCDPRV
jgi:hypothetical protein